MGKYLKEFKTNAEYEAYINGEPFLPNVSIISDTAHFTPNGIHSNGHAYVDLGLPSGTLWATCNVGTSLPEGYGDRYKWGEIQLRHPTIGETIFYLQSSGGTMFKYNTGDTLERLELIDDAAHYRMGGGWHIPTREQVEELKGVTLQEWTQVNGISGMLFISQENGNTIFFPATGYGNNQEVGTRGYYWTSSVVTTDARRRYAWSFRISNLDANLNSNANRNAAYYIRGVLSAS